MATTRDQACCRHKPVVYWSGVNAIPPDRKSVVKDARTRNSPTEASLEFGVHGQQKTNKNNLRVHDNAEKYYKIHAMKRDKTM